MRSCEEDWRSLYATEITLYSMRSCTLSQCSVLRIWLGLEYLELHQQHDQEHCGYAEGNITAFKEDNRGYVKLLRHYVTLLVEEQIFIELKLSVIEALVSHISQM